VAENSSKNVNHSFTVITPFQQIVLAAASRKEMEEWVGSFKMAVSRFKNAVSYCLGVGVPSYFWDFNMFCPFL